MVYCDLHGKQLPWVMARIALCNIFGALLSERSKEADSTSTG